MPYDDEIQQLTMSIWDSILKLPVEPAAAPLPAGQRTMSACVQITGAWRGAVALSCDAAMAAEAARVMFDLAAGAPATADMQDALGELVNMIGGNVKALLPETCQLSLPSVVEGSDYSVRVPGSRVVTRVPMRCGPYALSVSLLESELKAA
ncbi:MAG: chemotaxis protein CheX [Tepidisphaeraceae bacterium]